MQKLLFSLLIVSLLHNKINCSQLRITAPMQEAACRESRPRLKRTLSHDSYALLMNVGKKMVAEYTAQYAAQSRFADERAEELIASIRYQNYLDGKLRRMASFGDEEYLEKLITRYHARIDAPDADGKTALHIAAEEGNIACVEMLIRYAAQVNILDELGFTPLMYAMAGQHDAIVKLLIPAGGQIVENALFQKQIRTIACYNMSYLGSATTSEDEGNDNGAIYARYSSASESEEDEY